jgi:ferredoxin
MAMRKAAYKVAARATPDVYVIDKGPYCDGCGKCVQVCPTGALFTKGISVSEMEKRRDFLAWITEGREKNQWDHSGHPAPYARK